MAKYQSTHEPPTACYFMVADVLGFSNIIKNLPTPEQNDRVNLWIQIVESAKKEAGVQKTQLRCPRTLPPAGGILPGREGDRAAALSADRPTP